MGDSETELHCHHCHLSAIKQKKSTQHGQEPLDSSQLESPGYETCLPPTLANA